MEEETIDDLKQRINQLESEKHAGTTQISTLTQSLETLQEELSQSKIEVKKLEAENQESQKVRESLVCEKANSEIHIKSLKAMIRGLRECASNEVLNSIC